MSCADAPVATAVAHAASTTGRVSMSTRPDPERSGAVEIDTWRYSRLRVVWDLRELTHQQKPRLWRLLAGLGPVTVHPTRWGVGTRILPGTSRVHVHSYTVRSRPRQTYPPILTDSIQNKYHAQRQTVLYSSSSSTGSCRPIRISSGMYCKQMDVLVPGCIIRVEHARPTRTA